MFLDVVFSTVFLVCLLFVLLFQNGFVVISLVVLFFDGFCSCLLI